MAHFAEIDNDGLVLQVLVVADKHEGNGQEFLSEHLGLKGTWVQTSYNSRGGKRIDPATNSVTGENHFRYNFATIGSTYDRERNAFIPPKPHPDATLDEQTCLWVLPPEVIIDSTIPANLTE